MRNPPNDGPAVSLPSRSREGLGESLSSSSTEANDAIPAPSRKGERDSPERTCILTRRKGTRDQLIRLALGPDGRVAPDVRARAPGRGAWIGVSRAELDAANAKGRLKAALSRSFKRNNVKVPADLGELTERALRQSALDRLGMEARSGNLINGTDRVEAAARAGKIHMLIHASDAGEDGRKRLDQAWRVGGGGSQGLTFPEVRTMLSMALGRENVVHIALTDRAAAARVQHALSRWCAFIDPDSGLDGGNPARGPGSAEELDEGKE